MRYLSSLAGLVMLSTVVTSGAQSGVEPFVGTWKSIPAKSDVSGDKMTFSRVGADEMRVTAAGMSYSFKSDGKPVPGFFGMKAAWKQLDPNTWVSQNMVGDALSSEDTYQLGTDGTRLTVTSRGKRPDGQPFEDKESYKRVSGKAGLEGAWQGLSMLANGGMGSVLTLKADGPNGIVLILDGFGTEFRGKFDGAAYPFTGGMMAPDYTATVRRVDANTMQFDEKQAQKPSFTRLLKLSDGGKTLRMIVTATGASAPVLNMVYERRQ